MKISNDIKVSFVTAACIVALAAVSRGVLNVQLDFVSQYGPAWVFIAYVITREGAEKSRICGNATLWSLAVVLVTAAILGLYALP